MTRDFLSLADETNLIAMKHFSNSARVIFLVLLILLFFSKNQISKANNISIVDSLKHQLELVQSKESKIELLTKIGQHYVKSNHDSCMYFANQALTLAQADENVTDEAKALLLIGTSKLFAAKYDDANHELDKALVLFIQLSDSSFIAECYQKKGLLNAYTNKLDVAIDFFKKAAQIQKEMGNKVAYSNSLNDLGVLHNYKGDHKAALEFQIQSIEICKETGDRKVYSTRLVNLGVSYEDLGDYPKALDCYMNALEIKIELGDRAGESMCYTNLGEVYKEKGDYKSAIEYYEKSLNIDTELEDNTGIAICKLNIGEVHLKQKNYAKAREYSKEADELGNELNNERIMAYAKNHLGESLINLAEFAEAKLTLSNALKISQKVGDKSLEAKAILLMGELQFAQNNWSEAIRFFTQAIALHQEIGENAQSGIALARLAATFSSLQEFPKAVKFAKEGYAIGEELESNQIKEQALQVLADAYAGMREFHLAFQAQKEFKVVHDSIYTLKSKEQLNIIESRFELERNRKEIALQKALVDKQQIEIKGHKQRQLLLIVSLLGALLIVVLIVIYSIKLRKSNKTIISQKQQIEEFNEELRQTNEELKVSLESNKEQKSLIEYRNREITDSIQYARNIQKALLPSDEKLKHLFKEYFLLYEPKNIVSGDFYWAAEQDEKIIFAVADCTGHGVPGAFMSLLGISFLNDIVNREGIQDAGEILNGLRSAVIKELQQKSEIGSQRDGMEISLCVLDKKERVLQFAGARNPLYLVRNKHEDTIEQVKGIEGEDKILYELKADRMPIAWYKKMESFTTQSIKLVDGDRLYLFSDGFVDQFGGSNGKRFKYTPFKELLLANSHRSMKEQQHILLSTYISWKKQYEQIDDILILGCEV